VEVYVRKQPSVYKHMTINFDWLEKDRNRGRGQDSLPSLLPQHSFIINNSRSIIEIHSLHRYRPLEFIFALVVPKHIGQLGIIQKT
jgi:hypothetical protein